MRFSLALAAAVAALTLVAPAGASEDRPTLAELETEVVCPTCHTTLDQSSSPVAERMRAFIRVRIDAGDTKGEIKRRLVEDFGDQVLASPPKHGFNLAAWVLPPVAALAGAAALVVLALRWSRGRDRPEDTEPGPDPELDRRIDDELARLDT